MTFTRLASRIAVAIGAAVLLAPSHTSAQTTTARASSERIMPAAAAGCSGASWSRFRTADGTAYPVVTNVDGGSPANSSGLREGDVILAVNGKDARSLDNWFIAAPGEDVAVRILRDGKERELHITAGRVLDLAPEKLVMRCVQG